MRASLGRYISPRLVTVALRSNPAGAILEVASSMALPLYIPLCIHTPADRHHLPPSDQPLRIQIEGPLIAIQRLLPDIPWRLGFPDRTFPQLAGPELARLTYQTIYGRDICPEVLDDLVVQDGYLGWMPEKRPDE